MYKMHNIPPYMCIDHIKGCQIHDVSISVLILLLCCTIEQKNFDSFSYMPPVLLNKTSTTYGELALGSVWPILKKNKNIKISLLDIMLAVVVNYLTLFISKLK